MHKQGGVAAATPRFGGLHLVHPELQAGNAVFHLRPDAHQVPRGAQDRLFGRRRRADGDRCPSKVIYATTSRSRFRPMQPPAGGGRAQGHRCPLFPPDRVVPTAKRRSSRSTKTVSPARGHQLRASASPRRWRPPSCAKPPGCLQWFVEVGNTTSSTFVPERLRHWRVSNAHLQDRGRRSRSGLCRDQLARPARGRPGSGFLRRLAAAADQAAW